MRKKMLTIIPILSMALLLQGCPNKTSTRSTSEKETKDILMSDETIEEETKGNEESDSNSDATENSKESATTTESTTEATTESTTEATTTSETEKETHILKEYIRHYSSSGTYSGGSEIEYDESGNVLKVTFYDGNDSIEERTETEYDSNGNELIKNFYNSKGNLYQYIEWEYDSAGNCTKEECYNLVLDKVKYLYTWDYDANGNKIKWYKNDSLYFEYEYDASGNRIREVEYLSDGRINKDWSMEYDSAGNRIKKEAFEEDAGGTYYDRYIWEYDSNGNEVVVDYSSSFAMYRDEKEYDEAGNCIQVIRYSEKGGKILDKETWSYEYDDKGNIIKKYFDDGDWTEYEYVYSD